MQLVPCNHSPTSGLSRARRALILLFAGLLTLGLFTPSPASAARPALLSVRDKTVVEGDSGTKNAYVKVVMDRRLGRRASVAFSTYDGTAKAGADYVDVSGRVYFPAGTRVVFIRVQVKGDTTDERTEYFKVALFDASRARIADRVGYVRITDDDPAPSLAINDDTVAEGLHAVLKVDLSAKSGKTVTVRWETVNGPATGGAHAGHDYVADHGQLTFPPGDTTRQIAVETTDDALHEGAEIFFVRLYDPVNATINSFHARGTVTIPTNDG